MDESTQKVVLSLVAVIVGWFLGQGSNLTQKWWTNRKLKKSLLVELEDLKTRVDVLVKTYAGDLQIYAHKGMSFGISIKLTHPIYEKHYTDIFLKLKHSQRSSYEYIHGLVDMINKMIDREADLMVEYSKEKTEESLEQWGELIKGQFQNARMLHWHLTFHLLNKDNPELGEFRSEMHKEYVKGLQQAVDDMNTIIKKAKKLDKARLEKIYREEDFAPKK